MDHAGAHGGMVTVGEVNPLRNGFDPHAMLTDWDTGMVSRRANGRDRTPWLTPNAGGGAFPASP
jgi:hypothetical protein